MSNKIPELKNLPLSVHNYLNKLGLLKKYYPQSTGDWKKDCEKPTPLTIEEFNESRKISPP